MAPGDLPRCCSSNPDLGSCWGEGEGDGLNESDLGFTLGGGVKFVILEVIGLK